MTTPDEQLGRYRIVQTLGSGGFATVYLAEDPSLDTLVAAKVLHPAMAARGDIRSRFISEARLMRQYAAPGLITVHDIDEQDGRPFFVMEYCERGTLADRLRDVSRTASADEAMQLAEVLAAGVSVLHRAGVVHRDLKPTNFMIRRAQAHTRTAIGTLLGADEELVLGDFGLAKLIQVDATRMTLAAGTPGYSAPEQFTGDGSVDARADVYAASATLVAALTGVVPSPSAGGSGTVFPSEVLAATGPLEHPLRDGLSVDRELRQPTIEAWLDALVAAKKSRIGQLWDSQLDLGIDQVSSARRIGEGGFSVVYAAHHELLDRPVAIKLLARQLREADKRRFERECKLTSQLSDHANVVTVFHADYSRDGTPYVMMELVEGGTLADLVERDGPVSWTRAVELIVPIAGALRQAHAHGILHRDVKPENILLDDGIPKLTDFGIATLQDSTGATSSKVTASWLHTPPETFENSRDERSDLYSLASTLYHLVAGQAPFWRPGEDSLAPLMKRLINDDPPPLPPGSAPLGADEFLRTALAKDPTHRPTDAEAFAKTLSAIGAAGTTVFASQPSRRNPSTGSAHAALAKDGASPPLERISDSIPRYSAASASRSIRHPLTNEFTVVADASSGPASAAPAAAREPSSRPVAPAGRPGAATGRPPAKPQLPAAPIDGYESTWQDRRAPRRRSVLLFAAVLAGFAMLTSTLAWSPRGDDPGVIDAPADGGHRAVATTTTATDATQTGPVTTATVDDETTSTTTSGSEPTATTTEATTPTSETGPSTETSDPQLVAVPDVTNKPLDDAIARLAAVNLRYREATRQESEDVPEGHVISTDPSAGTEVNHESVVVTIVISSGPPRCVEVTSLLDQTEASARETITGWGLTPQVKHIAVYSDDQRVGRVTHQNPDPDTRLCAGEPVTISVAYDGEVIVPNLDGKTCQGALNALAEVQLVLGPTSPFNPPGCAASIGTVATQTPAAGTIALHGDEVTVTYKSSQRASTGDP